MSDITYTNLHPDRRLFNLYDTDHPADEFRVEELERISVDVLRWAWQV
jgi:hypothetical protein